MGRLVRKIVHATATNPSLEKASARAVRRPEIKTPPKPAQKPANFKFLLVWLPLNHRKTAPAAQAPIPIVAVLTPKTVNPPN